ncbi:hypothetical protein V5O48_019018, partial [Marasmius crinis-equi]
YVDEYPQICTKAKDKPTGDGERLRLYEDALEAQDAIDEKADTGDLQDEEVLELSSDSEDEDVKPVIKTEGGEKGTKSGKEKGKEKQKESAPMLVKTYKVVAPLTQGEKPVKARSHAHQAAAVLQNMLQFRTAPSFFLDTRFLSPLLSPLQHVEHAQLICFL